VPKSIAAAVAMATPVVFFNRIAFALVEVKRLTGYFPRSGE
jgi:hypothetical protein